MSDMIRYDAAQVSAYKDGVRFVRWQMQKAALRLAFYALGGGGSIFLAAYLISAMTPALSVLIWVGAVILVIVEVVQAWEPIYKDVGQIIVRRSELHLLAAIRPAATTYRNGAPISGADRYRLSQMRRHVTAQIEVYRKEAEEWRMKGWLGRAAGIGALLFDLEDAQKALNLSYAAAEVEIRPPQVEPAATVTLPPVEPVRALPASSCLDEYR